MTTSPLQPHYLEIPQVTRKTTRNSGTSISTVDSGFLSAQTSITKIASKTEKPLFNIPEELPILSENIAAPIEITITADWSTDLKDFRRSSDESNPSSLSDASTPTSTKPLISEGDQVNKSVPKKAQLQVPKPVYSSELVRSEYPCPKTYADEIILRETVRCELPTFVHNTDFNSLAAHLISKKLLQSCEYTTLKTMPTVTEKGLHFYIEILPHKGRHAYRQLYKCLRDVPEHLGHSDLLEILHKALKDRQPPQSSPSDSSPTDSYTVHQLHSPENTHSQTRGCCTVQ